MQKVIEKPTVKIRQYRKNAVPISQFLKNADSSYPIITDADTDNVNLLREKYGISISNNKGQGWTISTWDYIGAVEFDNFFLSVIPSYGTITHTQRLQNFANDIEPVQSPFANTVKFKDEYNHPLEQLVESFVDECNQILTRGLYKSYQVRDESIPMLKGKLLLKQQIINQSKFNLKFHCEFDEFTANNLENIILLDCLNICQQIAKSESVQTDIRHLINRMYMEIDGRNVDVQEFKKLRYTRLNQNYKVAHFFAKLIITQRGLMNWSMMRTSFTPPYFLKTWELFEKFVRKLLAEYYSPLSIHKPDSITSWRIIDAQGNDQDPITMIPDIMGYKKLDEDHQNPVFIADAKMKDDPKTGDSYQMAFYLQKYGLKKGYFLLPQKTKMEHFIEEGNKWKTKILKTDTHDVEIQELFFDVDEILDMVKKKRGKDIENRLSELIPPEEFN